MQVDQILVPDQRTCNQFDITKVETSKMSLPQLAKKNYIHRSKKNNIKLNKTLFKKLYI